MPFTSTRISVIGVLKVSIILCWLSWAVFDTLIVSINVPTFHLDGAFQTASGLYRLDAGQLPGKDFYPYLGIGPLLLLYPLFKTAGANMTASVFAAQWLILLVGLLSTALIWQLLWRPKSFITSMTAGCLLFLASLASLKYLSIPLPEWLAFNASSGASLRPIRSVAPYLVAGIYYFLIFPVASTALKYTLCGLLTGLIALWSNDFAIASAGLFAAFLCIQVWRCRELQSKNTIYYLTSAVLSWITLLILITGGHPIELLTYNLRDVANDQWWYFAPYDESLRIFNFQQIGRLLSVKNCTPPEEIYTSLTIFILLAIFALRTRLIEYFLLLWIGTVLLSGGVVASVGGHLCGYFGGFNFWGMMIIGIGFSHIFWQKFYKSFNYALQQKFPGKIFLLVILGLSLFLTLNTLNKLRIERLSAKNDPERFFVSELGGYLHISWQDYIALAKNSKEAILIEEYWGLWSAMRKQFPSWPVDSVIHALGHTREIAGKDLSAAEIITSTRFPASKEWQAWNLSQNYWFYAELLRNWQVVAVSPATLVWKKRQNSRLFNDVDCSFNNNAFNSILVQTPVVGFYEITLQYRLTGAGRHLVMFRNDISFGGGAGGYVSIDPDAVTATVPVYAEKTGTTRLDIQVRSMAAYNFQISACSAKFILPADEEVLGTPWLLDERFFLTNSYWMHGIARNWAGFYLPNIHQYTKAYKVGKFVKLPDGEIRKITQIQTDGWQLLIFVEGELLNPDKVGLPKTFSVINQAIDTTEKDGK